MKKMFALFILILSLTVSVQGVDITPEKIRESNDLSELMKSHSTMKYYVEVINEDNSLALLDEVQYALGDGYTLWIPGENEDDIILRSYIEEDGQGLAYEDYYSFTNGEEFENIFIFPAAVHDEIFARPWMAKNDETVEAVLSAEEIDGKLVVTIRETIEQEFPGPEVTYTLDAETLLVEEMLIEFIDDSSLHYYVVYDEPLSGTFIAAMEKRAAKEQVYLNLHLLSESDDEEVAVFSFPRGATVSYMDMNDVMIYADAALKRNISDIVLEEDSTDLFVK